MDADEARMARLRRMLLEFVHLYARVASSFVEVVTARARSRAASSPARPTPPAHQGPTKQAIDGR